MTWEWAGWEWAGGNGNGLGGYVDRVNENRQCGMEIDRVDVEWEWAGTNCDITNYTHCCLSRVSSFRGCVFSFPQENKKGGLRLFTEDMVEVKSIQCSITSWLVLLHW